MTRSLFDADIFTNFGPCHLSPDARVPPCRLIQGQRTGELRAQVKLLCPRKPGIYGMVDRHGELIYVGKAKYLRTRLLSYFRPRGRPGKSGRILGKAAAILWEPCPSEFAALLRELELIRRWRPRCNVQGQPLRRRHVFVCLGRRPAPYLFLAKNPPKSALATFGPIPAGRRAQEAVCRVNDLFRLRDCPEAQEMVFPEQGELFSVARPAGCLRFEIGTCLGPCTGTCQRKEYHAQVQAARRFLTGVDEAPLDRLRAAMAAAAQAQQFERAAVLRDKIGALAWLTHKLQRLAREKMSFVYPVREKSGTSVWYLIHGGRTVKAITAPHDRASAQLARAALTGVYRQNTPGLLETYEHFDGMVLVSAWFRQRPDERQKALAPDEALRNCQSVW